MTSLAPWPTIQPHRLVWEEHSYDEGTPTAEVWYQPVVDHLGRDVSVNHTADGRWHVFYGAGYGPPHATRDEAIAAAEASIFEGAHGLVLALGGWGAVAAVVAAAATRPTPSGS